MPKGKTTRIAAIALLILALGLAWRSFPNAGTAADDKNPDAANKTTADPELLAARKQPPAQEPNGITSPSDLAPPTKLTERKESTSIRDLEKYGIKVEAEHVGKNSATGKVKVTVQGGIVLEADSAKMSSNGMLVAEGNPTMVNGGTRIGMGHGENTAMAIFFDEEKQSVVMRSAAADKVTKPLPPDSELPAPERSDPSK
ncbi:hypothetical protein [Luteolibacter soli]|uniref:Organic solvent tolerance-like N-terminal domain-containing protein n=1 Tax=Luteolibacter soli TaxID=3135280 RepID=A0ABU9AUT6_9BACT